MDTWLSFFVSPFFLDFFPVIISISLFFFGVLQIVVASVRYNILICDSGISESREIPIHGRNIVLRWHRGTTSRRDKAHWDDANCKTQLTNGVDSTATSCCVYAWFAIPISRRRTFCMGVLKWRVCSGVRSFCANVMPDAGNVLVERAWNLNLTFRDCLMFTIMFNEFWTLSPWLQYRDRNRCYNITEIILHTTFFSTLTLWFMNYEINTKLMYHGSLFIQ